VILERGKPGDRLTRHTEGGNPVGDHLFGVRNDLENGAAQRLKRAALRLLDPTQVLVNLLGGQPFAV
jgi:hypothetical protein